MCRLLNLIFLWDMKHNTDAQDGGKLSQTERIKMSMPTLTNRNSCSLCAVFMYVGQWSTATGVAAPRGDLVLSTTVSRPGVTKYVTVNRVIQTEFWRYQDIINTDLFNVYFIMHNVEKTRRREKQQWKERRNKELTSRSSVRTSVGAPLHTSDLFVN